MTDRGAENVAPEALGGGFLNLEDLARRTVHAGRQPTQEPAPGGFRSDPSLRES
jgi:hypothetical protein